jgi:hypothetical protein
VKANSIDAEICPCGCGNVAILLYDEDDKVFASGQLSPSAMINFAEDLKKLARKSMDGDHAGDARNH